ncbi:mobilization protein [Rhodomicrobium vannielii ATCC 17100]|uniref:Mobilization protein n=1 Tax=Rhodomicrobium vannielii (strain ATCC 17100 / DSM 162 / LMG 4299 / NCIMB 10020 / ATH 3.1.1) TaxID=648757 RepID=E3I6L8_RHOVT|nr:plasmid mobilization relaxosome protein MobC [Rhodomicrobium vannielii]ADP70665.1 mobilization protein [Rhodomicrobium vannielii ATCC 17100]
MPARGYQKPDPVDRRIRVQLTDAQAEKLARLSDGAGVSQSEYMRSLLDGVGAATPKEPPKPKRASPAMLKLVEIHELAMQVKKLGTNVNQLARQANTGMVPLTRREIEAMLAQHEALLKAAITVIEASL